ncbi:C-factor, partial [Orchesella cincta]
IVNLHHVSQAQKRTDYWGESRHWFAISERRFEIADVRDHEKLGGAVEKIEKEVGDGGLNLLINNAGISSKVAKLSAVRQQEIMDNFEINTVAPILMTKAMLPLLEKASASNPNAPPGIGRAAVVNVSSILGSIGLNDLGGMYAYRCSKAAINAATKSMHLDFRKSKIVAIALHPGWVRTDMGGAKAPLSTEESVAGIISLLESLSTQHSGNLMGKNSSGSSTKDKRGRFESTLPVLAESLHLTAVLVLLLKLTTTRSSAGVSGKSLFLLSLTYTFRGLDVFAYWKWETQPISIPKLFYMLSSYLTLYLTYSINRSTVEWDLDTFRLKLLIVPVSMLSFVLNERKRITQLAYTWSLFMESAALVPQLFMMWKSEKADTLIMCYLLIFGVYIGVQQYSFCMSTKTFKELIGGTEAARLIIDSMTGLFAILGTFFAVLGNKVEAHLINCVTPKMDKTITTMISKVH